MVIRRLTLCLFVSFLCFTGWVWWYAVTAGPSSSKPHIIYVPPGSSFPVIKDMLVADGVIADDPRFGIFARLLNVGASLKAGEYEFARGLSPRQVLAKMSRGDILYHMVTVPEGSRVDQIGVIFGQAIHLDQTRFAQLCEDRKFVASLGLAGDSLEGYLFPDTYRVRRGQSSPAIIRMMVQRFQREADELRALYPLPGPLVSRQEWVTLASIVEKETGRADERARVAAVFLNRLRRRMPLQADPTVVYGLAKFGQDLSRRDLKAKSPYNTYRYYGLPPGPIASPGRAALLAVLQPAITKELYFVAKPDGSHQFSRTLAQHNKAVRRYRRP